MRTRTIALTIAVATAMALPGVAAAHPPVDGTLHEFGEMVEYPMLFPVAKGASYTNYSDTFWAWRSGGEVHHATDIMAPKMTPVIAPKAGRVRFVNWSSNVYDPLPNPERCCNLTIDFDDGWSTWFIHLNNDTFGTDDGKEWGIAPGIRPYPELGPRAHGTAPSPTTKTRSRLWQSRWPAIERLPALRSPKLI